MFDLFDKENRDIVEKMNKYMGTKHRDRPYDLNNTDDLKQALLLAVAAYRDYRHYSITLDNLDEDFDESLEHFDTVTWFHMGYDLDKADELALDCASALSKASKVFRKIAARAEENLIMIVKVILSAQPDLQSAVLGKTYSLEPQEMDAKIEELFTELDEVQHYHNIQDNFNAFLKLIEELWADKS